MTTMPQQPQPGVMPAAMSYDVASDSINLAFDNPGYVTHKDIESQPVGQSGRRGNAQAPPLSQKQPIPGQDSPATIQTRTNGHYSNQDNNGFENAMYETMGAVGEYEPLPDVKEITMK